MERLYECRTCGVISGDRSHLCSPRSVEGREEICGTTQNAEICDPMKRNRPFHCDTCGRPAEKAFMVCSPIRDR